MGQQGPGKALLLPGARRIDAGSDRRRRLCRGLR
jgi:hypothetical protein